jgi:predicted small lipoprotein YifL
MLDRSDMLSANREPSVTFCAGRLYPRLAVFAVLAVALAVAGCGRKGALDLPPASVADPAAPSSGANADGNPVAPKGPNKRIPLDRLLD